MNIESYLKNLVDPIKIKKIASDNIMHWSRESVDEKRGFLSKSELCFISHKYCFESSIINHPYIESTFDIVFKGHVLGRYRLISLLDGSIEDDYIEIY